MSKVGTDSSNEPKPEDWAGEMGERWLANLDRFESMIAPIGTALLDRAAYQPGEEVLDLGSGGGATTRAIAQAVAPGGKAIGLDIAPMLVAEAQSRAAAQAIPNARFVCADAAVASLEDAPFDRLFSRFGSMFFEEPIPAFANLHRMLREDARIDLAVWGPPRDNPWMMELMGVVRQYVDVPPAIPRAPGPFAFEDLDYLNEVLTGGGFREIDIVAYDGKQALGGPNTDPEDVVRFVLSSLGVGRILEEQDDDVRQRAGSDLTSLFEQYFIPEEGVMMVCKAWMVSAKS